MKSRFCTGWCDDNPNCRGGCGMTVCPSRLRVVDDSHKPVESGDRFMLRMLHEERQRIIEALGLTKDDPGYLDGFAWNLVDLLKQRLAKEKQ